MTKTENGIWILDLFFRSSDFGLKNAGGMLTVYKKIVNEVICTNWFKGIFRSLNYQRLSLNIYDMYR